MRKLRLIIIWGHHEEGRSKNILGSYGSEAEQALGGVTLKIKLNDSGIRSCADRNN